MNSPTNNATNVLGSNRHQGDDDDDDYYDEEVVLNAARGTASLASSGKQNNHNNNNNNNNNNKPSYHLVRLVDDETSSAAAEELSGSECISHESSTRSTASSYVQQIMHRNILPDTAFEIRGIRILDGIEAVRFLKFTSLTFVGIVLVHWFVALMNWERDKNYSLADMIVYDSATIMLDVSSFYMVGRLFCKRGVDHLSFILVSLVSAIYMSAEFKFKFLRHSVSLFEMHCRWPWKLWLFCAILIPLISIVVVKHVQYAVEHGLFAVKLIELTLTLCVCLVPIVGDPNFHLHHWYAGWMLGMHANFDVWWSRATMAWCWGMYMQGIGVWGRDPVLTCAYAYYISTDEHCSYMKCYLQPTNDNSTTPSGYQPLDEPDWRNCSGPAP